MSFDLRIRFAGLMMWVPEGQSAMHVLLPSTEGHDHSAHSNGGGVHAHDFETARSVASSANPRAAAGPVSFRPGGGHALLTRMSAEAPAAAAEAIPAHDARVVYDAAYKHPDSTQLTRDYALVDLSKGVLELTGLPTDNGICMHLPDEIPSLARIAEPVPREMVRGAPGEHVAGRVTMDAGGMTFYELSAALLLPGQDTPQRMTAGTEWTLRGIRSRKDTAAGGMEYLPELIIRGADGTEVDRIPELYPIANTIHLTVLHAVSSQFPPKGPAFAVEATEDDPHFSAYFELCPARIQGDLTAREATGISVTAHGKKPTGPERPGAICVQARNVLAPS